MDIIRSKFHENTTDMVIPGVIREFDLPDLINCVAPRDVWIVNPITPTGVRIAPDAVVGYEQGHSQLHILDRPEDWPLGKTYAEWLQND